jgi:tricorn protease
MDWSPDGLWLAYECTLDRRRTAIKMTGVEDTHVYQVTDPVLKDFSPSFDPEGKYLYFLSSREFLPSHDSLHFELGFPAGMRPYMVTLRSDLLNPLNPQYHLNEEITEEEQEEGDELKQEDKKSEKIEPIHIDFEGIQDRIIALPIEPGQFSHAVALKGKLIYLSHPLVEGEGGEEGAEDEGVVLESFDLETKKTEEFIDSLHSFNVSLDRKFLVYESRKKLRIVKCLEKPDDSAEAGPKKSGWVDLSRVRLKVDPIKEWRQIYKEAWRLQRDHFWVEDMSGLDWNLVLNRYLPLVERVSSRRELSDVLWEMQGELGTSHAYVVGGDWKIAPQWNIGFLGARFKYNVTAEGYSIEHVIKGDLWDAKIGSPLAKAGVNLQKGDVILAVDGQKVTARYPLESHLVAKAKQDVLITFKKDEEEAPRTVSMRTLVSQHPGEYRDWVNKNRQYVHENSNGTVGYIHIPDMSMEGYAEFHRGFLAECDRHGLIVDVRFNGGGSVSQLLLVKLARRRMGYDLSRWHDLIPYPVDSTHGRMVALTNEYAGSDGDMFSSMFKAMKLGPLIGKRTWGGVIGIWPKHNLIDAGYTTQPEYSFWSYAEGWAMENYGVDPDIEVEITPQDYAAGKDPQLEWALSEVLKILKDSPVIEPDLSQRPRLSIPQSLTDD